MVMEAVMSLREKGGSSRQSIFNFVHQKYRLGNDQKSIKEKLATAIR
jgi:linker histone H1 and H5 family